MPPSQRMFEPLMMAASSLARNAKTAAIIGPGVMSRTALAAIMATRPGIKTLKVKGRGQKSLQAFIEEAAIQCGFCTPGFIMSAVEIIESGKEYTDDELRKLLSGHLCRCTGYENILRAVKKAVKKTMYQRLGKEMPAE